MRLAAEIRAVEERWILDDHDPELPSDVETPFGCLRRRRLHEWLGLEAMSGHVWAPPMAVLCDAAQRSRRSVGMGLIVWVGRAVWPYAIQFEDEVLSDCLMVDPPDSRARLWAIEVALRSEAVCAVVGDGSGLNVQATRRLQLAAESGRALALLARPPWEKAQRSAAAFRWEVRAVHSTQGNAHWSVELVRGKDAAGMWSQGGKRESGAIELEWHHGQGLVAVPAVVVDRAAEAGRRSA